MRHETRLTSRIFAPLLLLACASCGSASNGPSDPAAFEGTWRYEPGGTMALSCAGAPTTMVSITGSLTITQDGDNVLLIAENDNGCSTYYSKVFSVAGSEATPNNPPEITSANCLSITIPSAKATDMASLTEDQFSLSGSTLTRTMSGSGANCEFSGQATLKLVSQ